MMDCSNNNQLWDWDYDQKDPPSPHIDISPWDGDQNYLFHVSTPVKDSSSDFPYNTQRYTNQDFHSPLSKRRRTLQFDNSSLLCTENTEYTFDAFQDQQESMDVSQEDVAHGNSTSSDGSLVPSPEPWLSNSFDDACINLTSHDMSLSDFPDVQIDISDFCDVTDEMESDTVQLITTPPRKQTCKGKKSYIRTPTNLLSSVAYPFALIKPCGIHGDVTIKDINHRILTPAPLPRSIYTPPEEEKHVSLSYTTSAFSGKPVVVKTKIRTEGGKGSITIMRTKG